MKSRIASLFAVALVSACAKSPASIAPAYVSSVTYSHLSCERLKQEAANLDAALTKASAQQEQARSNDIAGVILIGLPVSSMSGDNIAPQIADLKGPQRGGQAGASGEELQLIRSKSSFFRVWRSVGPPFFHGTTNEVSQ